MMFPDQVEDESTGSNKAAVTFSLLNVAEEQVVEMSELRPSADCQASSDSRCTLSFDLAQLIAFVKEQLQGGKPEQQKQEQELESEVPEEQAGVTSVTVLFQDATGDDEAEPSLPEEVQDLLGDESVDAFLVAFVSPTAVQTLLAQTQTASGSDKRASLLVNAHFGGLVSRLGEVLGGEENFSSVRGIVDAQGNFSESKSHACPYKKL